MYLDSGTMARNNTVEDVYLAVSMKGAAH